MTDTAQTERKVCRICGKSLPVSCFWTNPRLTGGLEHKCKRCTHAKAYGLLLPRDVAKEKTRRINLITKYGLDTVEMLECEYRMGEDEARETVASAWLVGPPWES